MRLCALGLLMVTAFLGCTEEQEPEATGPGDAVTKEWERGPLTVRLSIRPKEPTIVDPIHLTLEAEVRRGYELTLPGFGDGLGGFLISDYRTDPPEEGEKTSIYRAHYELQVFLSGEYTVEPMVFAFRSTEEPPDATPDDLDGGDRERTEIAPPEPPAEDAAAPEPPAADSPGTPAPAPPGEAPQAPPEPSEPGDAGQPEDSGQPEEPAEPEEPADTAYKLKTEPVTLTVLSLEEGAAGIDELAPPAQPEELPQAASTVAWYVASGIAGAAALSVVLFLFLKKRLRRVFVPPPIPPHETAYRELKALLAEDLIGAGQYKEFYFRLTFIVRQYIERRFGLRAPEQTTEEFLGGAASSGRLSGQHQTLLQEFLNYADLIKYAKYVPQAADVERSFNAARTFINQTRPHEAATGGSRVPA